MNETNETNEIKETKETKESKIKFTFTSIVLAYIISDNINKYFGLKPQGFSMESILSIVILIVLYLVINFLLTKIVGLWNKNKKKDR